MYSKIIKAILIILILLPLKILINNYFVPKEFYWDKFSRDWKNRDYRLEDYYGCPILEIGKKGKYYYGRVSSDSGTTFYRPGNDDFTSCKKNEYFLIDKNEGLDIDMFHDKKDDILNVVHEYKVKKPYEFFIFSILR